MDQHRPTFRLLPLRPRRCRHDGLTWPCPTVIEDSHGWNGDGPIPHLPPTDFIESGRRVFDEHERRRDLRRNGGPTW